MSESKLSQSEARDLFGAYALGALAASEEAEVRKGIAGWAAGQTELRDLMETAALLPLVPEDTVRPSIALEGRVIAAARKGRSESQTAARARRGVGWLRSWAPHTLAMAFAALAITLGLLWATEEDPLAQGRWLPLEATGSAASEREPGWVYVTDYQGAPVSLLFWHTPAPPVGQRYQLFRLLADGSAVMDQVVRLDAEGAGILRIAPKVEEQVVGFALALIEGDEGLTRLPPRESVVFRFPAR